MSLLASILASVSEEHAGALEWFVEHEGEVGARPWRIGGESVVPGLELPLVAQRGIHKPRGWSVALSVTATPGSLYLDGLPTKVDSETWVLAYQAHAGPDGVGLRSRWNRALHNNLVRHLPVGVFVPSGRRYLNLGLAMVQSYDPQTSSFLLRGPLRFSQVEGTWLDTPSETASLVAEAIAGEDLEDVEDDWALAAVRRRREQERFRRDLLGAYLGKCAVTGCNAVQALQGAHILAYNGRSSQRVDNGILLRADVHLLFDHHLVGINPDDLRVRLAPIIAGSSYAGLGGRRLGSTVLPQQAPSPEKLAVHWAIFERAASSG